MPPAATAPEPERGLRRGPVPAAPGTPGAVWAILVAMADGTSTRIAALLAELRLEETAWVAAVTGSDPAAVIRACGGAPEAARPRALDERLLSELTGLTGLAGSPELTELPGSSGAGRPHLAVARAGPAVTVLGHGDHRAPHEEMLRRLAAPGARAAGVHWGRGAPSRLSLAEDGALLSAFDLRAPAHRYGSRPAAWDAHLDGLDLDGSRWRAAGVTAVLRATGARLDAAWARGPHLVVPVAPVAPVAPCTDVFTDVSPDAAPGTPAASVEGVSPAPLPREPRDSPLLAEEPFAGFLARLGPECLPAMERYGVELAARHNGLASDPVCTLALAVLDGCGPPEARQELRIELARRAVPRSPGDAADRGPVPHEPAVWQTLGVLLAREEGAVVAGPPPMCLLDRAMSGGGHTPEAERYALLRALYEAAQRAPDA